MYCNNFILLILFFLVLSAPVQHTFSQCVSTGATAPGNANNSPTIGTIAWTNPANALLSDDARTTSTALLFGDVSNYLYVTNFNFAVPPTAVICGITVQIEKSASGIITNVQDNSIRLLKEGIAVGNNYAVAGAWPDTDANFSHGGVANLWGTTWTPAEINSPNFGVAISVNLSGSLLLPSARIDLVRITVHYDNTLPVELVNFKAQREGPVSVKLNWETLSELNNDYFKLEQSDDGSNWSSVGKIKGKGNSSVLSTYNFTDENGSPYTTYYRLKQVDFNGDFSYSDIIAVPPAEINYSIVYPNPSLGTINIRSEKEIKQIVIYNAFGEQINLIEFDCDENEKFFQIDMSHYPKGNYLFHIYSCSDFREIIKVTLL